MLEQLKFVQGAIAKRDFIPALTHFYIHNGFIKGYNGQVALCAPIELDITASPLAAPFIKAIQCCDDVPALHLNDAGNLVVRAGKFRAVVPCTTEPFPDVAPEGYRIPLQGDLLSTFKMLAPIILDDASRVMANSLLLRGQSAFATNNVILVERWMGSPFPIEVAIPRGAVLEIVRIGEEPIGLCVDKNSVTFIFTGNRWLRTQLYNSAWPDVTTLLNKESVTRIIPVDFFSALKKCEKFCDEHATVIINAGTISTHADANAGAQVTVTGDLPAANARFKIDQLKLLDGICEEIEFLSYPSACAFYARSKLLRGVIMGCRY
jgi:DNA polymerase III sliding clamp (beta) subunit (PCNA family)